MCDVNDMITEYERHGTVIAVDDRVSKDTNYQWKRLTFTSTM